MTFTISGCFVGYWTYSAKGGGSETAKGESHEVQFAVKDALVLTQDVLRGEGILYVINPDQTITTFWKPADVPAGFFGSAVGLKPQYRYEIQVVPEAANRSNIIVNTRTSEIPQEQIPNYQAGAKLNFFNKFDQLAATAPPASSTPSTGGVNFVLLPNESLMSLAKRATGDESNWKQIAQDNGLKSATDVAPFQTIWVRNTLLKETR